MSLREQLDGDLKAAMMAKDAVKTGTLRMLKSAVRNKEIDTKKSLDDAEMVQLCSTLRKQREESITQFIAGNRQDLADKEKEELAIIMAYLPAQMSQDEIDAAVKAAAAEAGATSAKDMGKVMKVLTPKTTGKADGKLVSERVKAYLASLG